MSKFLVAPDSFKDCLSAQEVSEACTKGIKASGIAHEVNSMPLSDGGEGVLSILLAQTELEEVEHQTFDPLRRSINSRYLWDRIDRVAYLSVAEANGLELLSVKERNPMVCSSFGTGISIRKAIERRPNKVVLFLGGSSSNDAGTGIGEALGFHFYDASGALITDMNGSKLIHVHHITPPVDDIKKDIEFIVAADVKNPFFGNNGASAVYAPQKGANKMQVKQLEKGMVHFYNLVLKHDKTDINFEGAGAAGGIAGGLAYFLKTRTISAFSLISKTLNLSSKIKAADVVISGEGKLDEQSFNGKLVGQIYQICTALNTPLILVCGSNTLNSKGRALENVEIYAENKKPILVTNPAQSYTYIKDIGLNIGCKYG